VRSAKCSDDVFVDQIDLYRIVADGSQYQILQACIDEVCDSGAYPDDGADKVGRTQMVPFAVTAHHAQKRLPGFRRRFFIVGRIDEVDEIAVAEDQ
jgi:hypothetical protein